MIARKIKTVIFAALAFCAGAAAQVPEGYAIVDSLIFTRLAAIDTTLSGRNIFSIMPPGVMVYQPENVRQAVADRVIANDSFNFSGYRIRIFFDNSQNARGASAALLYRFKTKHPGVSAYRTFDSPNFKVTVGDYRTKSEALAALKMLQTEFPSAFVVQENFKYPAFAGEGDFRIDTLKVLRRL